MATAPGKQGAAAVLPVSGRRNVLVTSALPYVNNVPHLGNLVGCVLSADVFARYCRLLGHNVLYVCGTDEYGTATETKALEEGCSPSEICDKYHAIHKEVYEWFDISFDHFGRTSSPQQTEICQAIFHKLWDNNWLSENTMQQLYCESCQRFLADRFVVGSCPTEGCDNDFARGDQCEKCGKLLNSTDLVDPKCKVCGVTPCVRDTDHLFLELPQLREKLEKYIDETSVAGSWSQNAIHITDSWLKEGLKPRCITRDLKWGVPVPHEKYYKDKFCHLSTKRLVGKMCVSMFALIVVIVMNGFRCSMSVLMRRLGIFPSQHATRPSGRNGGRTQRMFPFHTVMFPSALLGTGENWTLMRTISVIEYLKYESGKFSKTRGIGVFGNDAKATNIPADVWRYYLLSNRPEASDAVFTWTDLQAKFNNELINNLGNFVNRVLSFIAKPEGAGYSSIIPDAPNADSHPLSQSLAETVGKLVEQYIDAMDKVKLKQGLKIAMAISSEGNAYLQESQFWKLYKQDEASCAIVMKTSAALVYLLACLLEPFMPSFSKDVLQQLNLCTKAQISFCDEKREIVKANRPWDLVPANHKIGKPVRLFKALDNDAVARFREIFAGSQAERNARFS